MNESKILVVDDESEITELIALYLEREGYDVHIADDGEDAIRIAATIKPDLIVLDILLKSLDGIEVCKRIRADSDVPILFLSCKSDDTDIIHGLSIGGDDYVTKPFSPSQLVARVKAHLRRQSSIDHHRSEQRTDELLVHYGLHIDTFEHTVHVDGKEITLSAKEFELLVCLAQSPNRAFTIAELYNLVWGYECMGDARSLMVHVSNLRRKIEPKPAKPVYILTVRGVGYKFNAKEGTVNVHR